MTNEIKTMEDESLPHETSVPQAGDLATRLRQAAAMRAKGTHFYQGTVNLPRFTKALVGEGFFITSDPLYKTQPKSDKRDFASEVVQFTIRRIMLTASGQPSGLLGAELATLSGAYLLNQVRSMTINELHGYPWTVWQNDLFTIREQVDGRIHPYMLALYDPWVHQPQEDTAGAVSVSETDAFQADPIGPNGHKNGGYTGIKDRKDVADVYADYPAPDPTREQAAQVWQQDWTAFNVYLRHLGVTLSEAREYLGLGEGETWQGRDLREDRSVLDALVNEPSESPQEQLVAQRRRGRPRKDS